MHVPLSQPAPPVLMHEQPNLTRSASRSKFKRTLSQKALAPVWEVQDSPREPEEGYEELAAPSCRCWVMKHSNWFRGWIPRFFLLAGRHVQYFEEENGLKARGEMRLTSESVVQQHSVLIQPDGICLYSFTLRTGGTQWLLAQSSEQGREQLMKLLDGRIRQNSCRQGMTMLDSTLDLGSAVQLKGQQVKDVYRFGKELARTWNYSVIEGVHRSSESNYCLKMIPKKRTSVKASANWDALHASRYQRLQDYVKEVYSNPRYVVIVMQWGTHVQDADNVLSTWILEALSLLHELMPESPQTFCLQSQALQTFLQRLTLTEMHLQKNLFL